eukprot:TRINITY_DN28476_c2_g1_i1.p1 TRINITY_DN28476_c2_g1~~TRINITY_DN28476_c2_g1_i1.p1  ORF type:complete len:600 (+),score=252.43 TRINITY_DN28476_c2_g1_i1:91-1800(+)
MLTAALGRAAGAAAQAAPLGAGWRRCHSRHPALRAAPAAARAALQRQQRSSLDVTPVEAEERKREEQMEQKEQRTDREAFEREQREQRDDARRERAIERKAERDRRQPSGIVKYARVGSTKMTTETVLSPDNELLVDQLRQYAELQRRRGNTEVHHYYTVRANGVIDHIRKFAAPIRTSDEFRKLKFKFIPAAIKQDVADRIEEIRIHGSIAELEEDPAITARKLFQQLPGLMHKADDFVAAGYRTIQDIVDSPEYRTWSVEQQHEVQHYEDLRVRVSIFEAIVLHMLCRDHLAEWDPKIMISDTASVRRREQWAREHEVRFLLSHPNKTAEEGPAYFRQCVEQLLQRVNGAHEWEKWLEGSTSVMLKARVPPVYTQTRWRRLILRWVPYEEWVPQLIEATGHQRFVDRFRDRAKEKGWNITPTAAFDPDGNRVVVENEEKLFERIGEKYVTPWDRTEQGPQLQRRNNQFQYKDGEIKEKPRAQRLRHQRPRRPSYHQMLKIKQEIEAQLDKNFTFPITYFHGGFDPTLIPERLQIDVKNPPSPPNWSQVILGGRKPQIPPPEKLKEGF